MGSSAPTLYRLDPEIYDRIVGTGALAGEPVELVDGLLMQAPPKDPAFAALVQWLSQRLGARGDLLRVQLPMAVPGGRPEPDLALAELPTPHCYPQTAHLVVEVMVSAHAEAYAKLPGYADAGIPLAWLVDVPVRAVHVFNDPRGREYRVERVLRAGDSLHTNVPGIAPVDVGELFAVLDR